MGGVWFGRGQGKGRENKGVARKCLANSGVWELGPGGKLQGAATESRCLHI